MARLCRRRADGGGLSVPFRRDSLTYAIAVVAVRTGIPPQFLWEDGQMLEAIIKVLHDQDAEQEKAAARNRGR